jgi:MbtH protein
MKRLGAFLVTGFLLMSPAFGAWDEEDDNTTYRVVINHEEQYSIWFADREIPRGWKATRFKGSKRECLVHIEEVWTDMRPLSFRTRGDWGEWGGPRDRNRYKVVINHEEQYSIWFADEKIPEGWKDARFAGTARECLAHIEKVWTDMRPLSWRRSWN